MTSAITMTDLATTLRTAPAGGSTTRDASICETGPRGTEGFAALLSGQAGGSASRGAPEATPETQAARETPGAGGQTAGVQQAGATAQELVATRVRLAGGLRVIEGATMQALDGADGQGAGAILEGAAQAIGGMLGQADAALGTDAMARLQAALQGLETAGPESEAGAGDGGTSDDPAALAGALFAMVSQSLGLARPGTDTQTTRSQLLLGAVADGTGVDGVAASPAGTAIGDGAARNALVRTLVQAGAEARQVADHTKEGGAMVPDPFAQLLAGAGDGASPSGAGLLDAGQVGAGLAIAQTAGAPAAAAVTSAAAAQSTLMSGATAAPAAAFSGFVTTQIRSADVQDGVTRIALNPRGLGEIELDMRRDDSGRLNVVLRVENPVVLSALRNDQARLTEILSAGGVPGQGGQPALDFQSFGGQRGEDNRSGQSGGGPIAEATETGEAAAPAGDMADPGDRIGRDALDIRI